MNIVLTGFMASGKSEISKAISKITGRPCLDTDDMVEKNEGMTINEIFAKHGEEYFRKAETEAIKQAALESNAVIATGGGVVLKNENIEILRKTGVIVNLAPEFEVIEERLEKAAATRPLLQNDDIEAVKKRFNDRLPFYANCDRQIRVVNGKTPMYYAEEILKLIKEYE